ncbi:hypothetical protein BC89_29800, partial [Pseudomonas monteilii]
MEQSLMAGMPWDDYAAAPQATPEPAPVEDAAPWDDYAATPAQAVPTQPRIGIADLVAPAMHQQAQQPWNANDMLPDGLRQKAQALDDYGLSLSKGMIGAGEGVVGLGDLATAGRVTPSLAHQFGYDPAGRRAALDAMATPEHQQAMQQLDRAQGLAGTLLALRDNPSLIGHAVTESLPSMMLAGVAGRGIAAGARGLGASGGLAGLIGAGTGEGLMASGQQASQTVQDNQQKGEEGLSLGQSGMALGSGLLTGLLGAAGARIGRRLGVMDIDAQMAGAGGVDKAMGLVNRALVGTGLESLEELTQSGQQQVLTNLATDRPAMEGVTKQMTLGGIVGGAMGGAAGLRRPNMNTPQPEQPAAPVAPQVDPRIEAQQAAAPRFDLGQLVADADARRPAPVQAPVPFAGSVDINPLLDNLNVQGEQRAQSVALLRPAEQDVEARRRGVVTLDEQRRLANLIGLDGAKAQAFSRQIGQAWNAEQTIAATDAVAERMKSVMEQQQRIASGQATDLEKASFVQDLSDMKVMFGELMGARAESGRALAAQRRQVQNINEAQRILEGIGGIQGADDLAAAIGKAVQAGGVQNLAKLVGQPETKMQRLLGYYFRSALLSGVRTHAVNITSNSLTLGNEIIERGIAAGVGGAKRLATGGKSGQTVFAEPLDLLIGMSRGMAKAGTAAADAFRTGESAVLGGQAKQDNAIGLNNAPRQPGMMGTAAFAADRAASLPYRALGAEDAFFATLNYEAELRTLARQQALNERSNGQLPTGMKLSQRIEQLVQDPTPKMIESAGAHARENTFNTKAGVFAQAVMGAKAKAPWLNLIVPFVRTPANVV